MFLRWVAREAAQVRVDEQLVLFLKQDERYLYLGIRFGTVMHTGLDLYLSTADGSARKLHVSAALGDASLGGSEWSEMRWGANLDWMANVVGLIDVEGRQQVVPLEGFEVVIARSAIPGDSFSLMLHLKRPEILFPTGADPRRPATWQVIRCLHDQGL